MRLEESVISITQRHNQLSILRPTLNGQWQWWQACWESGVHHRCCSGYRQGHCLGKSCTNYGLINLVSGGCAGILGEPGMAGVDSDIHYVVSDSTPVNLTIWQLTVISGLSFPEWVPMYT